MTQYMGQGIQQMELVKFVEDSLWKIWSDIICLGRPYSFKFFKGYTNFAWSILEYLDPDIVQVEQQHDITFNNFSWDVANCILNDLYMFHK